MTGLADFLLARIAEDEEQLANAKRLGGVPLPGGSRMWLGIGNHPTVSEVRLAAECEAKRRIVEAAARYVGDAALQPYELWTGGEAMELTLRLLALPYADHSDYQEEWKP